MHPALDRHTISNDHVVLDECVVAYVAGIPDGCACKDMGKCPNACALPHATGIDDGLLTLKKSDEPVIAASFTNGFAATHACLIYLIAVPNDSSHATSVFSRWVYRRFRRASRQNVAMDGDDLRRKQLLGHDRGADALSRMAIYAFP